MGVGTPVDIPRGAPSTFGADADNISVRTIDLTAARNKERFEFGAANTLWVIRASSPFANIDVRFNEQHDAINFRRGQSLEGIVFGRAYISNDAQAGENVTLLTVRDAPGKIDVGNPALYSPVSTRLNSIGVIVPINVTTLVSPANPKKRVVHLQYTGFLIVAFGDSTVGLAASTGGIQLHINTIRFLEIETSAAVYAFQAAQAPDVTVRINEFFED